MMEQQVENVKSSVASIQTDVAIMKADIGELRAGLEQLDQRMEDFGRAKELFWSKVLKELREIRGAIASAMCNLGVDFEFFGKALIITHLDRLGFLSPWIDLKKTISDRQDPEKTMEVGVYSEEPFLIGECTVELYSASQIDEFLEKVSFVKRAVGCEEEPKLFFFAHRVDEASVKEAAVKLLEEAGCHWYIAEETSKDL